MRLLGDALQEVFRVILSILQALLFCVSEDKNKNQHKEEEFGVRGTRKQPT